MLSPDEEAQIRALTYLVTVLIRRISESDEAWCRALIEGIRVQRAAMPTRSVGLDKAFDQTIAIIERALDG